MLDNFNHIVLGMVASAVDLKRKVVKVRIPQYHGLPNNSGKVDYYVKDDDLPEAVIMCPIGTSLITVERILYKGSIVYITFSRGELSYPIIVGWEGNNDSEQQLPNTFYKPDSNPNMYITVEGRPIAPAYEGGLSPVLDGEPGEALSELFILPYKGCTVNWPFYPYNPWGTGYSRHGGVDLGGVPRGTPIYSITDCNVIYKFVNDSSMGNSIWTDGVDEDGNLIHIQYMHMDRFAEGIAVGDHLNQGDMVGTLGTTGNSTGDHLHLGIRYPNGIVIGGQTLHVNEYRNPAVVMNVTNWDRTYEWYTEQPGY